VSLAPFTDDEVQGFAAKLHAWGQTLEPRERALLVNIVMSRADDDDVHGYGYGLADSADLRRVVGIKFIGITEDLSFSKSKVQEKWYSALDAYIRG
jgi:hypothetical protein